MTTEERLELLELDARAVAKVLMGHPGAREYVDSHLALIDDDVKYWRARHQDDVEEVKPR